MKGDRDSGRINKLLLRMRPMHARAVEGRENTSRTMQGVCVKSVTLLLLWIFHSAFSQNQGQGGLNNGIQDLLTAMESGLADESHPFYSLTPSTPLPSNINCYVEIPATRVGGQCVRLGRGRRRGRGNRRRNPVTWGCQAGVHLDMGSPDCNSNSERRSRINRLDG